MAVKRYNIIPLEFTTQSLSHLAMKLKACIFVRFWFSLFVQRECGEHFFVCFCPRAVILSVQWQIA